MRKGWTGPLRSKWPPRATHVRRCAGPSFALLPYFVVCSSELTTGLNQSRSRQALELARLIQQDSGQSSQKVGLLHGLPPLPERSGFSPR